MRRFLIGLLATIGGLALLVILAGGGRRLAFHAAGGRDCRTASC